MFNASALTKTAKSKIIDFHEENELQWQYLLFIFSIFQTMQNI